MQYMMLIHQGTTPTPQKPDEWATLSPDEQQAVYADYQAINQTPGVTPGSASNTHGSSPPPCGSHEGKAARPPTAPPGRRTIEEAARRPSFIFDWPS